MQSSPSHPVAAKANQMYQQMATKYQAQVSQQVYEAAKEQMKY